MLCRVEMPTNEQIFGRFFRWKQLHLEGGMAKFTIVVLPILAALLTVYFFLVGGSPWLPLLLLVFSLGFSIFSAFIRPNSIFRQKGGAALQTEVYIFTENSFTRSVRSEEGGMQDNSSHQYDILVRAVETGNDFYLFTGQKQAYLVDKEYFTKGDPAELRKILKNKLGAKFSTKQR